MRTEMMRLRLCSSAVTILSSLPWIMRYQVFHQAVYGLQLFHTVVYVWGHVRACVRACLRACVCMRVCIYKSVYYEYTI